MSADEHTATSVNQKASGTAAVIGLRYAKAFLDMAAERSVTDQVGGDMRALRRMIGESADLRAFLSHPRLTAAQQDKALRALAQAAGFAAVTVDFLALVVRKRRVGFLPVIVNAVIENLAAGRGEAVAEVTVAQPMAPAQADQLAGHLSRIAGGKVSLVVRQDTALIGGMIIKMGSRLVDASVQGKLARLARHLREAS